uniref:Goadsporin structure protein n=1 Tax=Streptomyces sp. TP-A0584 TaxID=314563 RepID=Q3C2G0_9ACTN|nr:goadsporin structure protein [Streptomyces sp. TP-A0584]
MENVQTLAIDDIENIDAEVTIEELSSTNGAATVSTILCSGGTLSSAGCV